MGGYRTTRYVYFFDSGSIWFSIPVFIASALAMLSWVFTDPRVLIQRATFSSLAALGERFQHIGNGSIVSVVIIGAITGLLQSLWTQGVVVGSFSYLVEMTGTKSWQISTHTPVSQG